MDLAKNQEQQQQQPHDEQQHAPSTPQGGPPSVATPSTLYAVEADPAHDQGQAGGVASGPGGGGGLQLTTITVAVPAPLSPSDVLQQHVVTTVQQQPGIVGGVANAPGGVTLPTVPAPQEAAVRWKYEQSKQDKHMVHPAGSSLVRTTILPSKISNVWSIDTYMHCILLIV